MCTRRKNKRMNIKWAPLREPSSAKNFSLLILPIVIFFKDFFLSPKSTSTIYVQLWGGNIFISCSESISLRFFSHGKFMDKKLIISPSLKSEVTSTYSRFTLLTLLKLNSLALAPRATITPVKNVFSLLTTFKLLFSARLEGT